MYELLTLNNSDQALVHPELASVEEGKSYFYTHFLSKQNWFGGVWAEEAGTPEHPEIHRFRVHGKVHGVIYMV